MVVSSAQMYLKMPSYTN